MKRGKRFTENNNIYIYFGTVIFIVLAIALGIIMYMLNKTTVKLQNNEKQVAQEEQNDENFENVSTEIGKKIDEQKNVEDMQTSDNSADSEDMTNNTNVNVNKTNASEAKSKNENKTNQKSTTTDLKEKTEENETNNKTQKDENKKEVSFIKPTEGEVICEFAKDNLIYSETLKEWITHTAIDIKADKTSVIKSAADGIVRSIVNDPRYGLTVIIEHDDGYETVYSNLLTAEFVVEGEEVKQGQTIGTVGNTAAFESEMECHLHFELLKNGEYVDPSIYLK